MSSQILLTGATGYVGSSYLQKWLSSSDAKLVLLARSKYEESAKNRIIKGLFELYPDTDVSRFLNRIEIVEGDVSFDHLGLSQPQYEELIKKTSHIIHCAAAARFDLELEEARKINVKGTENVLDFAKCCPKLEKVDYIGTSYVAGKGKGIIKEDELEKGQKHNNTYEKTKFEAEKLVRENMVDLPITILRLSIVISDSKTGRASSHNGFFRVLKMYFLGALKILPGYPNSLMDLVPLDYIADTTYVISQSKNSVGKCYHLTAGLDNMTKLEEIQDLASYYFGKEKFTLTPPEEFDNDVAKMEDEIPEEGRKLFSELKLYEPYLTSELEFDNSNTVRETGLQPPKISDYFEKMVNYIIKHST
jgi:thioester reductase-like protein